MPRSTIRTYCSSAHHGQRARNHQGPLMPRVTCRCGEKLKVPPESPEHMDCTRCGARIRLRRPKPQGNTANWRRIHPVSLPLRTPTKGIGGGTAQGRKMSRLWTGRAGAYIRIWHIEADQRARMTPRHGQRILTPPILPNSKNGLHATWPVPVKLKAIRAKTGPVPSVLRSGRQRRTLASCQTAIPQASVVKFETGLRVCPRCKKPLHLSADNCRECGMPVPRQ